MRPFLAFILISLCCLLTPASVFAVNWYVDNQAAGSNNGTSWQNAWKSVAAVNFTAMKSGDIVYISGGTASKTYAGTIAVPGGTTNITISKGIDSGHNGEVIFDGGGSTQHGVNIYARKTPVKNLTISNLTFRNYSWAGIYGTGANSGGLQGLIVDNCKFLDFNRAGVFFEGNNNLNNNYQIVVKNSYFDDNNAGTTQSDGIFVQVLRDFTADYNFIILDNNYTAVEDLHSDNIQSLWVDNVMYSNNVLVQRSSKTLGTQLLFTENGYGEHVFLNNVLIRDMPYAIDSAMNLKSGSGSTFTAKVVGNTYYGRTGRMLRSMVPSIIKNNILYNSVSGDVLYSNSQVSNNLISVGNGVIPGFVNASYTNPDLHLQSGSPAINAGANLASFGSIFTTDIEQTDRGTVWDIGAYEYSDSPPPTPDPHDYDLDSDIDFIDFKLFLLQFKSAYSIFDFSRLISVFKH